MHAPRPHAGVIHRDVAAKAVADEAHGVIGHEALEQRLEIGDVIVEPVALRLPARAAEAAQIGRDRIPIARERIDQELKRRADVHPAVQQDNRRRLRLAPRLHVVAFAAHVDEMRRRRLDRYFLRQSATPSCQPVR